MENPSTWTPLHYALSPYLYPTRNVSELSRILTEKGHVASEERIRILLAEWEGDEARQYLSLESTLIRGTTA